MTAKDDGTTSISAITCTIPKQKRLLIVSDSWHPQFSGVVTLLENLSQELLKRPDVEDVLVIGPSSCGRSLPTPTYGDIPLCYDAWWTLPPLVEAFRPDHIFVATEGPLGRCARRYCIQNRLNYSTAFLTKMPEMLEQRGFIPAWIWYFLMRTTFHNANSNNRVLVCSEGMKQHLQSHGYSNLKIGIPHGVDTDRFCLQDDDELPLELDSLPRPLFLYVGRVATEKNVGAFVRMKGLPGTKIIVGDGPQLASLQAEASGQNNNVEFLGPKHGDDLVQLYRAADVFVFPSRTETFGMVMLEALASGLPIAAFDVTPGPRDVLGCSGGDQVGVLHPHDLKAAALGALKLSQDPQTADRCRQYVLEHYSWKKASQTFLEAQVPTVVNAVDGGNGGERQQQQQLQDHKETNTTLHSCFQSVSDSIRLLGATWFVIAVFYACAPLTWILPGIHAIQQQPAGRLAALYLKAIYWSFTAAGPSTHWALVRSPILVVVWIVFLGLQAINWICLALDHVVFPDFVNTKVEAPVFVVGLPRSGTTFLHRVLARDTQRFTSTALWELFLAPSILQKYLWHKFAALDACLGGPLAICVIRLDGLLNDSLNDVHPTSFFAAEEDYFALLPIMACFLMVLAIPHEHFWRLSKFDALVTDEREKDFVLGFYKRSIQRHLYFYDDGGRDVTYLSKNPTFTSMIRALKDAFPDARFVACVRDPTEVVPSQVSSLIVGIRLFDPFLKVSYWVEHLEDMLEYYYRHLIEIKEEEEKEGSSTDLRFAPLQETKQNPSGFVHGLYKHWGLEVSKDYQRCLDHEQEKSLKYKSTHQYCEEAKDLCEFDDQRIQRFQFAFSYFGYKLPSSATPDGKPSGSKS